MSRFRLPPEHPLARRRVRIRIYLAMAVVFGLTFHRFFFMGNFGVVDASRGVYRSGQPRSQLARTIEEKHLASILNLRGGTARDDWYVQEVDTSERLGVDFFDLPMTACQRPPRGTLLALLDLFGHCRYPLLIHCKSGSDRTGLATALYDLSVLGRPPEEALRAFSVWYGHVPLFGPERLHEPLVEYAGWLRTQQLAHTPERFRSWVETVYDSPGPQVPPALHPGPRAEVAGALKAVRR